MKLNLKIFLLIFSLLFFCCNYAFAEELIKVANSEILPPHINYGKDSCTQCQMLIKNERFAATLTIPQKQNINFDDLGDLLIYYDQHQNQSFKVWVHDYNSKKWLLGENAFYVITSKVRTPMGFGILAFATETDARNLQNQKQGEFLEGFEALYNYFLQNKDFFISSAHQHHFGQLPIGVMGGHTHHQGGLMFSYRLMYMDMHQNFNGSNPVSTEEILKKYMVAPVNMPMFMHMAGLMYSPLNNLTLMGMVPFLQQSMNLTMKMAPSTSMDSGMSMKQAMDMNSDFSTASAGISDLKLNAIYNVFSNEHHSFLTCLGMSFPTGSINNKADTPMGKNQQMPYPMQLGSGTYDLLGGLTYTGNINHWNWGSQLNGTFRLGKNSNNYALGNKYNFTAWLARTWLDWLNTSVRVNFDNWGNISGADPLLKPTMVPTADHALRAGSRIDFLAGVNLILPKILNGNSIGFEFGLPVYQNLTGPQLGTNWYLNTGLQLLI